MNEKLFWREKTTILERQIYQHNKHTIKYILTSGENIQLIFVNENKIIERKYVKNSTIHINVHVHTWTNL